MNAVKRIFCRSFQTFMWLAIPFMPYRDPLILGSVLELPKELKKRGVKKVLLVTDSTLRMLGKTEGLERALAEEEIACFVYDGTVQNPTISNVEAARKLYVKNGCEALIGLGGGAAMDCAKAVGVRIARPKTALKKMAGTVKVFKRLPLLIAVPSTAGTGSETTPTALISDSENEHKFTINDFVLIPDIAVLDPEMTRSLPKNLTASTGMDALTHAIEAFLNKNTKMTRAASLEAAELIENNIKRAYENGDDMEARGNMLRAAYLAGKALGTSYVGYCHAVAHSLGGKYGIAHGYANAVILPYVMEEYGESIYKKGKKLAEAMGLAEWYTDEESATKRLIEHIRELNRSMGIGEKLAGIREEDIYEMSRHADKEGNPLYPVPLLMDRKELEKIYRSVAE